MRDKKHRARTGCLTCRARRVKCDEQVPVCRRCTAANVDCAGYEQRRVVPIKLQDGAQQQQTTSLSPTLSSQTIAARQNLRQLRASISKNGEAEGASSSGLPFEQEIVSQFSTTTSSTSNQTPLVAFPSNPRPSQCPSFGARQVLGYHQVLLRTLPILFAPDSLQFWRDELVQEAWGCEYLYLTLVALGNGHRAALMAISNDKCDQANGLHMKITAVQLYTQALQNLAKNLEEAKQRPVILVAVLCLMAYFEVKRPDSHGFLP